MGSGRIDETRRGVGVGRADTTELVWKAAETARGVVVMPGESRDADAAELLKSFVGLGGLKPPANSAEQGALSQSR